MYRLSRRSLTQAAARRATGGARVAALAAYAEAAHSLLAHAAPAAHSVPRCARAFATPSGAHLLRSLPRVQSHSVASGGEGACSAPPSYFAHQSFEGALARVEGEARLAEKAPSNTNAFEAVNTAYRTLLANRLHDLRTHEVLRLVRSWLVLVPEAHLSEAARTALLNQVLTDYFIERAVHLDSLVGVAHQSLLSGVAQPSTSNSPMQAQHEAKADAVQPKDLFRDIILHHHIRLDRTTLAKLVTHAAVVAVRGGDAAATGNLISFLVAYKDERWAVESSITSTSINEFNSLLSIYAEHGDMNGAGQWFGELGSDEASSERRLLFVQLRPDANTFAALLDGFCALGHIKEAISILEHMYASHPTTLTMATFERMIAKLIQQGHVHEAILLMSTLQPRFHDDLTEMPSQFGIDRPSAECFLPLLLEIPRYTPPSAAPASAESGLFADTSAAYRFKLLTELHGKFVSYDYELDERHGLDRLIERVFLLGSGRELRERSTENTEADRGFTERNLELTFGAPPVGEKPEHEEAKFFAWQLLEQRLAPFKHAAGSEESVAALAKTTLQPPIIGLLNSMLYLFGVLGGDVGLLEHLAQLLGPFGLTPNVHTMNLLIEGYGRAGNKDNATYMYQQVREATLQQSGPYKADIQTVNCALDHTLSTAATSNGEAPTDPFAALTERLADMRAFGVAPNHATWMLVRARLVELSGNADEAALTHFTPASSDAVPTNTIPANETAFALPTQQPDLVFAHFHTLVECQLASVDAAAKKNRADKEARASASAMLVLPTAASTSSASNTPQSTLTGEVIESYLLLASKLGDFTSVHRLVAEMEANAINDPGASPTSRALPHAFCREYFESREHLRRLMHFRVLQQDWAGCVALLRIWVQVVERTGGGVVAIGVDHFAFFRHLYAASDLTKVVRSCFDNLVATPAGPIAVGFKVGGQMAAHIFHALVLHARFAAAVDFLDLVATARPVEQIFPSHALPQLMQAVRASAAKASSSSGLPMSSTGTAVTSPAELAWALEVLARVKPGGKWHNLVPAAHAVEELRVLQAGRLAAATTAGQPIDLDEARMLWKHAVDTVGPECWMDETGGPALDSSRLKHRGLLELTERLVSALAPKEKVLTAFAQRNQPKDQFQAKKVDATTPHEVARRTAMLGEIIGHHVLSAQASWTRHGRPSEMVLKPLLSVTVLMGALEYAIRVGHVPTVTMLFKYACGRSLAVPYFTHESALLPGAATQIVSLPNELYDDLFRFCLAPSVTNAASTSSSSATTSTNVNNPVLAFEALLQLRAEGRTVPIEAMRTLLTLQACYTGPLPKIGISFTAATLLGHASQLGRNQVMHLWMEAVTSRPWHEAYSLLPDVANAVTRCTFHSSPQMDWSTKVKLLDMLESWAKKHATTPMPFTTTKRGQKGAQREDDKVNHLRRKVDDAFVEARARIAQAKEVLTANAASASASSNAAATGAAFPFSATSSSSPSGSPSATPSRSLERTRGLYALVLAKLTPHGTSVFEREPETCSIVQALSRSSPNDLVAATKELTTNGALDRWARGHGPEAATIAAAYAATGATPTHAFFVALLGFMQRWRLAPQFAQMMLGLAGNSNSLSRCLDATASGPTNADGEALATEDVALQVIRSLLPRTSSTGVRDVRWTESTAPRGGKANGLDLSGGGAHAVRLVDAHQLSYCKRGGAAWWTNALLYWHFRLHSLPILAFHPDFLFMVKPGKPARNAAIPSSSTALPSTPSAATVNQHSITPRMVHEWVSALTTSGAVATVEKVANASYLQTYRFLVHELRALQHSHAYSARIASLSSADAGADPRTTFSTHAETLAHFTFHLFKRQYQVHRTSGAGGRVPRARQLDLAKLETQLALAISTQTLEVDSKLVTTIQTNQAAVISGSTPANSVYTLFHLLSSEEPSALGEPVYSMTMASLVQFRESGVSAHTLAALRGLHAHMRSALSYRLAPQACAYMVEALLEQAQVAHSQGGHVQARPFLMFAQEVIEAARQHEDASASSEATNKPHVFDAYSSTRTMPKPTLPLPAGHQ